MRQCLDTGTRDTPGVGCGEGQDYVEGAGGATPWFWTPTSPP
eukprot:CAMPEP_0174364550 /NCGR_PEP_ID=MMETSP0811_2-20130205/73401_1 /TAXON_ID=73025 ORGANISM="Eutreptiella gymnastica-like, Strain CCMP1594" /NCGR_SAMPLE_ID=MMETSP0811_2 /ASSEMBLY_ACC=CAM_ASM_000667 /LENGTH=41 /DNA_ID= /DNA_START= /DNA_END= /DNA_ORIENTATION=